MIERAATRPRPRLAPALPLLVLLAIADRTAAVPVPREHAQPPAGADEHEENDAPRLGLFEAAERALAHAPALAAARAETAAAEARLREAHAARRPTANAGASAAQHEEPALVAPIHGFTPELLPQFDRTLVRGELRVRYEIYSGGARPARIAESAALAGAAAAVVDVEQQAAAARAAAAFLEVLALAETLDAHRDRLDALRAEEGRVRTFLEAGRAATVELRRVEAAVAAAEAERVRLATRLDTAERELARLVALPVERTRAPALAPPALDPTEVGPMDRAALAARAIEIHPAVRRAAEQAAAAEAAIELTASARRPRATADGAYLEYGSDQGDFTGEWSAGVAVAVPLYLGGAHTERLAAARSQRDATLERLRATREQVEREVDRAAAALEESIARARGLAVAVESFAEVARIERLRLDTGAGVQADYLDAQADLLAARADLARARYGVLGARVELARATAELSLDWLARNLETTP